MKKRLKILTVLFVIVSLILPLFSNNVMAETDEYTIQHWNIMFVIDDTKSMYNRTDPNGLRYEAINCFIDTLWNKGDYVGVILFRANNTNSDSEKDMQSGLVVDTWKNGAVAIENNKTNLKKQVTNVNPPSDNFSDVGTALFAAEQRIESACTQNGLPGAIFLLTDGGIDMSYNRTMTKANEYLENAITAIKEKGIILCGTYMNTTGEQSNELRDVVTRANSFVDGDLILGRYYFEIDTALDISYTMDKFMELLGFYMPKNEIISSSCEREFNIPGTGAEELNIRFHTLYGEKKPNLNVEIIRPNGTKLSDDEIKAIYSFGDTYVLYKIHQPDAGTWKLKISLPDNNKVPVTFDRIFNIFIEACMETVPVADLLHSNMNVSVQGFLSKRGEIITDKDSYLGYRCELKLTEEQTGKQYTYPIEADRNNEYRIDLPLDTYENLMAKISFSCNEFSADSDEQSWILANRVPTMDEIDTISLSCSILENEEYSLDLEQYFNDIEDGKNLEFIVDSTTCNNTGIKLAGSMLTIDPLSAGSGIVTVKAFDSQKAFASADIEIDVFNSPIETVLNTTPELGSFFVNKYVDVEVFMTDNGEKLTNTQLYNGYECKFVIKDVDTGEIREVPLEMDGNGEYHFRQTLDETYYGTFEVSASFQNDNYTIESESQVWDLKNNAPKHESSSAEQDAVSLKCSILENEEYSLDLEPFFNDIEDGRNLRLALDGTTCNSDGIRLAGNILTIDPLAAGSGTVTVKAYDSQGAFTSAEITVDVFNSPIEAAMNTIPELGKFFVNNKDESANVDVEVYLTDNGEKLTNTKLYDGYESSLLIKDINTEEAKEFPLEMNENGEFHFNQRLDDSYYGTFEVSASFSNDQNTIVSESQTWNLENNAPECERYLEAEKVTNWGYISFLHSIYNNLITGKKEVMADLTGKYEDKEDDVKALKVSISEVKGFDSSAVELDENEGQTIRVVAPHKIKSGDIIVKITDTQGASNSITIPVECPDYSIPVLIGTVVLALIIIIIIILGIKKHNSYYPRGTCRLEFDVTDENDRDVTLHVNLTPPGNGIKNKTNLYEMLMTDMTKQSGSVRAACESENVEFTAVESLISGIASDLKNIAVSFVVGKTKEKGKIGKVKVKAGKTSTVLFNSAVKVTPGGHAMSFAYDLNESSPYNDDGDYQTDDYSSSDSYDDTDYNDYSSSDDDF